MAPWSPTPTTTIKVGSIYLRIYKNNQINAYDSILIVIDLNFKAKYRYLAKSWAMFDAILVKGKI